MRIEFFGDEIDRLSYFDPLSQRRTGVCPGLSLLPAREVTVDADARARITHAITAALKKAGPDASATLSAELAMAEGGLELPFADKYISLVYPEPITLHAGTGTLTAYVIVLASAIFIYKKCPFLFFLLT